MHDKYGKPLAVGDLVARDAVADLAPAEHSIMVIEYAGLDWCMRCGASWAALPSDYPEMRMCGCILTKLDGDIGADEREGEKERERETT